MMEYNGYVGHVEFEILRVLHTSRRCPEQL